MQQIGFIGTGVMGSRMVKKMLGAGYRVLVYNRSPEKVKPLEELGAHRTNDIASLAEKSDVICTCLSMPHDTKTVYFGSNGVFEGAREGSVCIDFTTVDAATSQEAADEALKRGIHYLDAPVSGGPEGVVQGSLTIMVGGDQAAFSRVQPLLHTIGKTIKHLGPSGSGSIAKLINQYLVAVHSLAASEAMAAGAAYGLDSEELFQLLKVSYGQSRMLERHMEQYVLDRDFAPGGAVKYVHKDVRLANEIFERAGLTQVSGRLAENAFARAMEQGLADFDMSAVIQPLEKDCNVIVKKKDRTEIS
jgi:3-hydroxyisobutyrate dehydrogenase